MIARFHKNIVAAFAAGTVSGMILSQWSAHQPSTATAQDKAGVQSPAADWLKGTTAEMLAQVERQLRGLDITMAEVGYRYDELVEAAQSRNWEYAKYQTEKIALTINLGLERRPKRAKSARVFLDEAIPPVVEAIAARDPEKLDGAINNLHRSCIQCHRAENVLYMGNQFAVIHPTADATAAVVSNYMGLMTPDYLAAADRSRGRKIFSENCEKCHRLFGEGSTTGPDLTILQRLNVEYLVKTIVDPNALVGLDYQSEKLVTTDGRTMSGLVIREDEESLELQTATETITIPKDKIDDRSPSSVSVMPEGLLQDLSNDQVRDLLAYLQGDEQAPLPIEQKSGTGRDRFEPR